MRAAAGDEPDKRWKFQRADLEVRRRWQDYQRACEHAVGATATPWAPWTIVPADSKTHRNLMIALFESFLVPARRPGVAAARPAGVTPLS